VNAKLSVFSTEDNFLKEYGEKGHSSMYLLPRYMELKERILSVTK